MDGVDTAARARVLAAWAAGSGGALGWGVGDGVAWAGAAALEDVVEADPVADFVGAEERGEKRVSTNSDESGGLDHSRSAAEVVGAEGAAGQGAAVNHDTVELGAGGVV